MLFYTKKFLLFFALSFTLHFLFRKNKRIWPALLLIASCVFYAHWDKRFLILMFGIAVSDFIMAILIEQQQSPKAKRVLIVLSVIVNLSILGFFKYYNFFAASAADALTAMGFNANPSLLKIVLPIGISFFTFESLSYVIEVYRGQMKACRNFVEYFLFIAFFPHLVAGPIIQPKLLIAQFRGGPDINPERLRNGIWRFFLGLSKKLLIADQLAYFAVDPVFSHPEMFNSVEAWIGVLAYSFQIYFDFSGYSDMAIGLARIYGFDLPENFNFPYLAESIRDFWRRWHISLSTWLRDYLYISLGGGRTTQLKKYRNVFITMLLGGLWHGASYNFIIWGALHGLYIVISHALNDYLKVDEKLNHGVIRFFKIISTFLLVSFAWIFFRAENLTTAMTIIKKMFSPLTYNINQLPLTVTYFLFAAATYYLVAKMGLFRKVDNEYSLKFGDGVIVILIVCIVSMVLIFDQHYSPFIYFQF